MKIGLLQIIIFILSTVVLYPQKKMSIQPLSPKQSLTELNQSQLGTNPEYERVRKEYENLIRKYPDKKELFYNLGT